MRPLQLAMVLLFLAAITTSCTRTRECDDAYEERDGECVPRDADAGTDAGPVDAGNEDTGATDAGADACTRAWYRDQDMDDHGDPTMRLDACEMPAGYVATDDDCDDTMASRSPSVAEVCDGQDQDCDSSADEAFACVRGVAAPCTTVCGSTGTGTCDDTCAVASPATCAAPTETCNHADDDCDGLPDDGLSQFLGPVDVGTATATEVRILSADDHFIMLYVVGMDLVAVRLTANLARIGAPVTLGGPVGYWDARVIGDRLVVATGFTSALRGQVRSATDLSEVVPDRALATEASTFFHLRLAGTSTDLLLMYAREGAIYARHLNPDLSGLTAPTVAIDVTGTTDIERFDLALVEAATPRYFVAYGDTPGGEPGPEIFLQEVTSSGIRVGMPQQLSNSIVEARDPSIAVDGRAEFLGVGWAGSEGMRFARVSLGDLSSTAVALGSPVATDYAGNIQVVSTTYSRGRWLVAFTTGPYNGSLLRAYLLNDEAMVYRGAVDIDCEGAPCVARTAWRGAVATAVDAASGVPVVISSEHAAPARGWRYDCAP